MMGFQAEGAAPIVRGHVVEKPETIASAIRIGNPTSWQRAVVARDESDGIIDMVTDEEILKIMVTSKTPETSCQALIKLPNMRGGFDTITVITARLDKVGTSTI